MWVVLVEGNIYIYARRIEVCLERGWTKQFSPPTSYTNFAWKPSQQSEVTTPTSALFGSDFLRKKSNEYVTLHIYMISTSIPTALSRSLFFFIIVFLCAKCLACHILDLHILITTWCTLEFSWVKLFLQGAFFHKSVGPPGPPVRLSWSGLQYGEAKFWIKCESHFHE